MSLFPAGLFIGFTAFVLAIRHLNQNITVYYDQVALIMVLGGTAAVGLMLVPWDHRRDVMNGFLDLFRPLTLSYRQVLKDCIESMKTNRPVVEQRYKSSLYGQVLTDGIELVQLDLPKERIEQILLDRVTQYGKRKRKVANSIRSLAKYPPAFGLMGTVLGLVNVMRSVSNGADGKQTALEMAIALIATMYGLIMANLLVSPAGETILKKTVEEETFGEIAIHTVSLMAEKASLLEAQEILNSYAPSEQRVNALAGYTNEEAA